MKYGKGGVSFESKDGKIRMEVSLDSAIDQYADTAKGMLARELFGKKDGKER